MKKIIVFNVREEEVQLAQNWAERNKVEIKIVSEQLSMENVSLVEGFDGVSTSQNMTIPNEMYAVLQGFGIKQIAQRSAGFDYYDLESAKAHDIIISNVPVYSPESIGEYAVTASLMLIRKMKEIEANTKAYDFRWQPQIRAGLLQEMTVGIIGTGNIGRAAASMFKGFGSKVIGYDLYPNDAAREILEYKDSIEAVIQEADVISLHVPATKDNHHQFNEALFKQFKPNAYLINAARGSVINTEDLMAALDKGYLAGAALDTYEFEGAYIPKDNSESGIDDEVFVKLLNHDKILFTPHIAHYTDVSVRNIMEIALNSVLDVLTTGDTKNRVN